MLEPLQNLSPEQRSVLLLHDVLGAANHTEAAARARQLGLPPDTARPAR